MSAYRIGLTGSIGMGKSTTAQLFADLGVPVWDADAVVHRLYAKGGLAVDPLTELFPHCIVNGAVDRDCLRTCVLSDPDALQQIEAVVHPLVAADREHFVQGTRSAEVLFDIPLLFETGQSAAYDTVVLVSAPPDIQRARVLARPGMTPAVFDAILAKQMPDIEKRALADYIVDTSGGVDDARAKVRAVLANIRGKADA